MLDKLAQGPTRLLIIDEVLSILGWSKIEYDPERSTSTGTYTDYRLTLDGESRLIVEAKRIGVIQPLPKTLQRPEYANSFLFNSCGPELKSLLQQCRDYCTDCGLPYAVATTGEVWIVLISFRTGVEWGKLRSFVFHSLDDVAQRFAEFYGLLARESVKNNSLEERFGSMVLVKPSAAIRPGDHVPHSPDVGVVPERQSIEAYFNNYLDDITRPGRELMLEQCYVSNQRLDEFQRDLRQILEYDAVLTEQDYTIDNADEENLESELEGV